MGPGSHLGRGIGAKPYPALLVGLPDFTDPFAAVALPDTSIHRVARLPELLPASLTLWRRDRRTGRGGGGSGAGH